ncbi:MAG: N-acetyl-1-D-myo-inositol-2-amino-2-deoxy-alpha-D-glucopyranoside deacetylase [Chloroflexi bacterium]|nr:N-acetyl-1-D-myo-inositol-2-amino-2-deoxy-alpha-D-glucopyranoside deacetylase [Chloroflexota bacterium]MBV9599999.1 N-acetyl-1-D-myo-inositol-2-amino-2-deoxy-alpha-D-glucopyranoside deacetylase [Chloroflexota bacterium]
MPEPRTLLAVHAHPDDECISTGGILARYAAEGVRTVLVTCTDGAVGEISDPALATPENLAEVRSRELDESVRVLRVSRLVKLGYRDSGMAGTADNDDPRSFAQSSFEEALERVVRVVREEQPRVVVTYDERGGYGHPDHVRAHRVAVAAFEAAGDAGRFPAAGPAWSASKLYYAVVPRSAMRAMGERMRAAGIEAPFREIREDEDMPFGVPDERVTTFVDVSKYIADKRASLVAHRTQMGADQFFMRIPESLFGDIFGRETFQRVVGSGPVPEDDLFAGL